MFAIVISALVGTGFVGLKQSGSGSAGAAAKAQTADLRPTVRDVDTALSISTASSVDSCRQARKGLRWYRGWYHYWTAKMRTPFDTVIRSSGCPRYLAKVFRAKAHRARLAYEAWYVRHMLQDVRSWPVAVNLVQRFFPGTASWLLSCSDAEGYNRGDPTRWVVYGGGSFNMGAWYSDTVGGPLQFRPSTFGGMYRHGLEHIMSRGYRVPAHLRDPGTTMAWRSMLAQAIAGGWARFTGNDNSHWSASWGNGC